MKMISLISMILASQDEILKFKDLFFDIKNPLFVALVIFLLIINTIFISYKYIYRPLLEKHATEKEALEAENLRLQALFVKLDPNPVIRVSPTGYMMDFNETAKHSFGINFKNEQKIGKLFPKLKLDLDKLITSNSNHDFNELINGRFYQIHVKGISYLNCAQIYFNDITERKNYSDQSEIYQKKLVQLSTHLNEMLEEDRNKISGELHDSIGQNLLLLKLKISRFFVKNLKEDEDSEKILSLLNSTISKVKTISYSLKPVNVKDIGLEATLKELSKRISKQSGILGKVEYRSSIKKLNENIEFCVIRCIQESLNNIIQHSGATYFTIEISSDRDNFHVLISDNGVGFKAKKLMNDKYYSTGLGLINMQERIIDCGGNLIIDSTENNGTNILLDFQLGQDNYD